MTKLINAWIGLLILGGIMIFFHSQELNNDVQDNLSVKDRLERVEKLHQLNSTQEIAQEIRTNRICSVAYDKNQEVKECDHFYCKTIDQLPSENLLTGRP